MAAMPIMPIEPANAVNSVRPFFVMRLLSESESAVKKPMRVLPLLRPDGAAPRPASGDAGDADEPASAGHALAARGSVACADADEEPSAGEAADREFRGC